ncbi:hypothetical protein LY78DRAFT_57771 [Colletotrichum sublineola]|uniref:Uncharacterized protein n=1 Tax=Colletotrichum sublineola TaxID=1173701 RepID=A0A066XKM9_COLSU|nr:hypothetical protein LY78DRAFT_57771 [Colletotrichum sublineola]KDN66301.1 hypothetical protein CSUB01_03877 [Colletotrichum sublineola]
MRVAEVLSEFQTLQYYIAAAPTEPANMEDYWTEGWAALRQCSLDGQHILNCAADTSVPQVGGGLAEQEKAELKQCLLDAFARRHECQKIYRRQAVAQQWISTRDSILQGERPNSRNGSYLRACDQQLRAALSTITDDAIYNDMQASDSLMGRWTAEDPSLRAVQRWLRARRPAA